MRATRRRLLQLSLVGAVAGCTPEPTIRGEPGSAPDPVEPTRSPEAEAVAVWVERFAALVGTLAAAPDSWGADAVHSSWISALQAQSTAHVSRVVAQDPVIGGATVFPVPSPTAPAEPPATTPKDALAALTSSVADGVPVLQSASAAADGASERLLYISLAAASTAGLSPGLPPSDGGAEPAPFDDPGGDAALEVTLSHVWALLRGLELGLGRLGSSDALQKAGTERLDSAKVLRNDLLAALTGEVPDVEVWEFPNALSTAAEIRSAWAVLEGNLLNALAALAAAGNSAEPARLQDVLDQVKWMHRWGGRLPHWPGWVAAS